MSGQLFDAKGNLAKAELPPDAPSSVVVDLYPKLSKGIARRQRLDVDGLHTYYDYCWNIGESLVATEKGVKFDIVFAEIVNTNFGNVRIATADFTMGGESTELANRFFKGRIISCKIGKSAVDSLSAGGVVGVSSSELLLANDDGYFDTIIADQRYINASIRIWGMTVHPNYKWLTGTQFSVLVFTGRILSITRSGRQVAFTLGDAVEGVSKDLMATKFDGSAAQGGTALKDLSMPVCIGQVSNITPVYVGQQNIGFGGTFPTFQVNWSAISDVSAVRIRGVSQTKIGAGTPTIGQYRVDATTGRFQLGSSPSGIVTCDVLGHSGGTYSYSADLANVARKLMVDVSGAFTATDVPDTHFAAILAQGGTCGVYFPPEKGATLVDALSYYCAGTLTVIHGLRDGKVSGTMFDVPTPFVMELNDYDILSHVQVPLPVAYLPRPDKIEFKYNINYTPMSDIADSITGDARTYLQGDARSSTTNTSVVNIKSKTFKLTTHFANLADAQLRINRLRTWFESAPLMLEVVTNRYLGQVELGMTCRVNITKANITDRDMKIVEFLEDLVTGKLTLKLIG